MNSSVVSAAWAASIAVRGVWLRGADALDDHAIGRCYPGPSGCCRGPWRSSARRRVAMRAPGGSAASSASILARPRRSGRHVAAIVERVDQNLQPRVGQTPLAAAHRYGIDAQCTCRPGRGQDRQDAPARREAFSVVMKIGPAPGCGRTITILDGKVDHAQIHRHDTARAGCWYAPDLGIAHLPRSATRRHGHG